MIKRRDFITKIVVRVMMIKGHADVRSLRRNTVNARKKNERLLYRILKKNRSTQYGKKYDFAGIKSVEDYRRMVPLTTYHDYEGYISRMIENNETGLLTALPLAGYAQSSGSSGNRKFIPLTGPEIRIYTKYTVTRMLAITERTSAEGLRRAGDCSRSRASMITWITAFRAAMWLMQLQLSWDLYIHIS